jgi:hypothetical protein
MFVESVIDKALDRIWAADEAATSLSDDDLLAVRDAAMLATAVGHVGLTVRISTVRTIKDPEFASTACTASVCTSKTCKGNRLLLEKDPDDEDGFALETFVLDVPHHKNSSRGVSMPKVPITCSKLSRLLYCWIEIGRPTIISYIKSHDANYVDPQTLFITKQGKAFNDLSKWYRNMHLTHQAPYSLITLQAYRSVFVSDRLENPDRPGPCNEGAATIMGNSVKQWEASYYKNKRIKQAEKATQSMAKYRRSHLVEQGYIAEEEEAEEEEEDNS